MNREQMIAWLTLEGWVPYSWISSKDFLRFAKSPPQHKEKIWQFNGNRWVLAGAGIHDDYDVCPWDWFTEYQLKDFMEAIS